MPHPRTLIRNAFFTALSGNTSAVTLGEAPQVPYRSVDDLPAIGIHTPDESTDADSAQTAPRRLERNLDVVVECWVAKQPGVKIADTMDEMALEIEAAIDADKFLGGTVGGLGAYVSDTQVDVARDGQVTIGRITLVFRCVYQTEIGATATDDFVTCYTEYNLGNAVEAADAAYDDFHADPEWVSPAVPVIFSGIDGFDGALASWLSIHAGAGAATIQGSYIELNPAEPAIATYTTDQQIMVYHSLPGTIQDISSLVVQAPFEVLSLTTPIQRSIAGVFMEDENTGFIVAYGASRGTGATGYYEGQWNTKTNENYNWFNDAAGSISGNPTGTMRMELVNYDPVNGCSIDTYFNGIKRGTTQIFPLLKTPTRVGVVYRSYTASTVNSRIGFSYLQLDYSILTVL